MGRGGRGLETLEARYDNYSTLNTSLTNVPLPPFLSLNALRPLPLPRHFLQRAWPRGLCPPQLPPQKIQPKKITLSHK